MSDGKTFLNLSPMRNSLLVLLSTCLAVGADVRIFGLASVGEAPFQQLSDVGGSAAVPQCGLSAEYSTEYLTPYSKTILGYYNHGIFAEEYVGIQLGVEAFRLKPALTVGTGVQSANEKRFTFGDEYRTARKVYFPFGFGARLDAFEKVYGEWDWRVNGYPWWKVEFGYRIF